LPNRRYSIGGRWGVEGVNFSEEGWVMGSAKSFKRIDLTMLGKKRWIVNHRRWDAGKRVV
jgi:hypothetical protein